MTEELTLELTEWAFPEVDKISYAGDVDLSALFKPDINENEFNQKNENLPSLAEEHSVSESGKFSEAEKTDDKDVIHYQVLDKLKIDYESRIELITNLINKLKAPASLINEELIELLQDIIKKIVKKIIYNEIATDVKVLPNMINELKSLIDSKNGMTSVYLSEQDYNHLQPDQNHASNLVEIDHALHPGDIVIKSNYAEVRALLNDRLDQIIRIENE